jgi:predicted secreted protein
MPLSKTTNFGRQACTTRFEAYDFCLDWLLLTIARLLSTDISPTNKNKKMVYDSRSVTHLPIRPQSFLPCTKLEHALLVVDKKTAPQGARLLAGRREACPLGAEGCITIRVRLPQRSGRQALMIGVSYFLSSATMRASRHIGTPVLLPISLSEE